MYLYRLCLGKKCRIPLAPVHLLVTHARDLIIPSRSRNNNSFVLTSAYLRHLLTFPHRPLLRFSTKVRLFLRFLAPKPAANATRKSRGQLHLLHHFVLSEDTSGLIMSDADAFSGRERLATGGSEKIISQKS